MRSHVFVLLFLLFGLQATAQARVYTFGIVPQQSSARLAQLWTPVLQALSDDTGMDIRFATAKDIPTFERRLAAGGYDFAYMNPYHFTVFNEAPGYVAMAHQSKKRIRGIIVVRKDNAIDSLQGLHGQRLAFPSPAAFAATILPSANMAKRGIDVQAKYVSSHDSVYMAVSRGLLPAGGGILRTFNNTDPEVRESLRILWTSEGYTPHAFAAHPAISGDERERVARSLVSMANTEQGRDVLAGLGFGGIESADDASWDDVRELQIRQLRSRAQDQLADGDS